jgi:hypothetical protein
MNDNDREISARAFGHLEAEVAALRELVKAQTVAMTTLAGRMDLMTATLTEARGGWRMLMLIGGAAASVGGFVVWVLSHVQMKGSP